MDRLFGERTAIQCILVYMSCEAGRNELSNDYKNFSHEEWSRMTLVGIAMMIKSRF